MSLTDLIAPPYRSPSTGVYSPNIADADECTATTGGGQSETLIINPPSPQGTVLRTSPRPQVQPGPPTARCWPCGAGAKPRWPWPCGQSSLQHAHVDMRRPRSRRHQPLVCRPARSSSSSEGGWFTGFQEASYPVPRNKKGRSSVWLRRGLL